MGIMGKEVKKTHFILVQPEAGRPPQAGHRLSHPGEGRGARGGPLEHCRRHRSHRKGRNRWGLSGAAGM